MSRRMSLLLEVAVNFLLPWLCYRYAAPQWGETAGLLFSALPPVLWSAWELLRFRRLDAISLLVLLGIALSLLVMLLGGDARMLLMRESLLSGAVGAAFLLSLLFPRPILFYLARATMQREGESGAARCERLWEQAPFRAGMRRLTVLWGAGLMLETALRAAMAWRLPVERFLLLSPLVSYGMMAALFGLTWLCRKRMGRALALAG
nr:VC0807 family protein [Chromobacterium sp. ASV5]